MTSEDSGDNEKVSIVQVFYNKIHGKWAVFDKNKVTYHTDKSEAMKVARRRAKDMIPSDVVVGSQDATIESQYRR